MSYIGGAILSGVGEGLLSYGKAQQATQARYDLEVMLEQAKQERLDKARQAQASAIKQGVDTAITERYGKQDNALTTDDTSPIRKPSRAEALQIRHDVASDLGYDAAATEARQARISEAQAGYYESRPQLATERLAQGAQRIEQGDRRLGMQEEVGDARIELMESRADLNHQRAQTGGDIKPLTTQQKMQNLQIDAARKNTAGLDEATIKRKTQQYSQTGRENPDYDPNLSRRIALAGKRKFGDDPHFDSLNGVGEAESAPPAPKSEAAPAEGADVSNRFAADPVMKGKRLGRVTPQGREVFDANGKLLGHYR